MDSDRHDMVMIALSARDCAMLVLIGSGTTAYSTEALSAVGNRAFRYALGAVCVAVSFCAGRRPEEVAAEIARRAVAGLRAKLEARAGGETR